jgi:HlyD family secretion protein
MNNQVFFKPTRRQLKWLSIMVLVATISSVTSVVIAAKFFNSSNSRLNSLPADPITHKNSVSALGRLAPQGEVIHLSAPAFMEGARVEKLLVKLGDQVRVGQVIAILDSRDRLQASVNRSIKQMKVAQAQLVQVKAGAKKGTLQAQFATIQQIQAELSGQMATQTASIDRLKTELQNAQAECRRYQNLYRNGAISAFEYDNRCLGAKTINQQLQAAQFNLHRTRTTLNQQLQEARATFAQIAEVRPTDVAVVQAQLEEAMSNVVQSQANLNLAYVRSPQAGQVLKIHTYPGELVSSRGIVEIGQTQQMYAIAEVYETDINQVDLGQSAVVTAPGFPNKLVGVVDEIGLQIGKKDVLGTDPAADVDARVVEVKIRLNHADSRLVSRLTNLKVNIIINTGNST